MPGYVVELCPAGEEINLTLRGPGLQQSGRLYVFANTARCAAFAEAVNFAYQQGLRDGRRETARLAAGPSDDAPDEDCVMVVSGRNPDDLRLRPETFWERCKRRLLG
jgi:hypothetical protein